MKNPLDNIPKQVVAKDGDINQADYYFSFARRYVKLRSGLMSRDVQQSYRRGVSHPGPQFSPRNYLNVTNGWYPDELSGNFEDFSFGPGGNDAPRNLRRPDPTDHGAQNQRWVSSGPMAGEDFE